MKRRFLKFEETEEGTAILTYDMGFGEETHLLPLPFTMFMQACLVNEECTRLGEEYGQHLIKIPNSTEDL